MSFEKSGGQFACHIGRFRVSRIQQAAFRAICEKGAPLEVPANRKLNLAQHQLLWRNVADEIRARLKLI